MNHLNRIFLCLCFSIVNSFAFGQQIIHIKTLSNNAWNNVDLTALNVQILNNNHDTSITSDSLIELINFSPQTCSRLKFEINGSSFSMNIDTLDLTIYIGQKLREESKILCQVGYVDDSLEEWLFELSRLDWPESGNGIQYFLDCFETGSGLMPTGWNPKLE